MAVIVSIHAPLRGATDIRSDQKIRRGVSIHAPLRGATRLPGVARAGFSQRFNPRTPAGCDLISLEIEVNECLFQSTHPCGVRP